ncbi:hypothetical protein M9H77_02385 [Catharanthus roseus]|uniref:Uncharacterized protein n=1 Tax=Catharanthus roseus TaxID=4058 RepID=A0ACC0C867_CATRO|nr:hypothetical protein M9H77_02385 [Catharanthus roseus]
MIGIVLKNNLFEMESSGLEFQGDHVDVVDADELGGQLGLEGIHHRLDFLEKNMNEICRETMSQMHKLISVMNNGETCDKGKGKRRKGMKLVDLSVLILKGACWERSEINSFQRKLFLKRRRVKRFGLEERDRGIRGGKRDVLDNLHVHGNVNETGIEDSNTWRNRTRHMSESSWETSYQSMGESRTGTTETGRKDLGDKHLWKRTANRVILSHHLIIGNRYRNRLKPWAPVSTEVESTSARHEIAMRIFMDDLNEVRDVVPNAFGYQIG